MLLFVAVAGAVVRPAGLPAWVVPTAAAGAGLAIGAVGYDEVGAALGPLVAPIGFLLAAVPLAVGLERLGFFEALSRRSISASGSSVRLWVLGAFVTTVFNLDAAVVLLTPLYVRIALRDGLDPRALAFQPALLACLASSALPVSNLTNLVVAERFDIGTLAFLVHLGPASLAATVVGWFAYRRHFGPAPLPTVQPDLTPPPDDTLALRIGAAVTTGLLVGFVAGPAVGIDPWLVAASAALVLAIVQRQIPWRAVPVGTAALVASLGLLAPAAARDLNPGELLGATGPGQLALTSIGSAGAANAANNLPALLLVLDEAPDQVSDALWAALLGLNMGPALLVTGSLSGLLWLDTSRRLGISVTALDYTRVGVAVALPASLAAIVALLATLALV